MMINEKISFYKESLDCFDETMEKYKFLLPGIYKIQSDNNLEHVLVNPSKNELYYNRISNNKLKELFVICQSGL